LSLAVQLGLFAGMRISEIAALQWKDIDLKNGFIQVRRNVQRVKNHEAGQRKTINQIGTPKSPKAFRSIPIISILMKSLKGYEKSTVKPEAFVIAKKGGSAYDVRTIQRYFKKIISVLKLDNYRFHDLRHPYVKHTTKKYNSEKQKTQTTNLSADSLGFLFLLFILRLCP
ncbi:MAG: site-specific integrase, partial [Hydrogeniiclostridium mannosilyticum]